MITPMTDDKDKDFEFVRQNYRELLVKGSEALEEMIEVARATEHPRAFEVLSGMMKNVSDINGNLLDLHKKKKEVEKEDQPALPPGSTTNNNVFVGSTSDLQRFLAKDITPEENEIQGEEVIPPDDE